MATPRPGLRGDHRQAGARQPGADVHALGADDATQVTAGPEAARHREDAAAARVGDPAAAAHHSPPAVQAAGSW